ncbi:hypothetical protein [uncultured Pseudonocardia sp.]|uniref:hypothetical protein n=1 Tax=uncultured Pseudonocardia sp. TaxID=211455 RepID=UPI002627BCA5|nr:hypothetical protein [uncultured Pseudonocardia sp.]
MIEIGARRRAQPAPPHIVPASLITPDGDPTRPWGHLLADERRPCVVERALKLPTRAPKTADSRAWNRRLAGWSEAVGAL